MSAARLAADYARELVGPLLEAEAPGVPVALARLGSGSDVLGLDDAVSRDHDWGLRLSVLVPAEEVERVAAVLDAGLPERFRGHPVRFPVSWDPVPRPRAEVDSVRGLVLARTGVDIDRPLGMLDWLALSGQAALEVTAGPVFRDDAGELARARELLAHYPEDLRRFAIACGWTRIGQELPFVARTAARGDDAGSRAIAARLVTAAMQLGFLLERRWAPYPKWLGTAFRALPRVGGLAAPLRRALAAPSGRAREGAFAEAADGLARVQAELGLPSLVPATERFWNRDALGLRALPEALRDSIADPALRALPPIGTPEQWCASVDLLTHPGRLRAAVAALYGVGAPSDGAREPDADRA